MMSIRSIVLLAFVLHLPDNLLGGCNILTIDSKGRTAPSPPNPVRARAIRWSKKEIQCYINPTGSGLPIDAIRIPDWFFFTDPPCTQNGLNFGGIPIIWAIGEQGIRNPLPFSADSVFLADIQATVTHEIGHLLGLWHSDVSGATMATMINTP